MLSWESKRVCYLSEQKLCITSTSNAMMIMIALEYTERVRHDKKKNNNNNNVLIWYSSKIAVLFAFTQSKDIIYLSMLLASLLHLSAHLHACLVESKQASWRFCFCCCWSCCCYTSLFLQTKQNLIGDKKWAQNGDAKWPILCRYLRLVSPPARAQQITLAKSWLYICKQQDKHTKAHTHTHTHTETNTGVAIRVWEEKWKKACFSTRLAAAAA